ncbi:MAG TPA: homocysteine S-methyltransferase [Mycobacteriales bacterium]|jgi:homocysteine S-methyltransferase
MFPDGGPWVLDGGLATELEARGYDLGGPLWSAALLARAPEAIVAVHEAYYRAGADVATTASYQASRGGYARLGIGPAEADALLRRSVALADEARRRVDTRRPLLVAASVGPYGAARADGSEYTGEYDVGVAELRRFHRPRLEVLAEAGADLLAVETVPCLAEVEALLAELDRLPGVRAWLSLTCAGGRTRRGEDPAEAFAMARNVSSIVALGVNCTAPEEVGVLLPLTGLPAVVYANSGEGWDGRTWTGPRTFSADAAPEWVAGGAAAVGGCCRVGPGDIAAVASALRGAPGERPRAAEPGAP